MIAVESNIPKPIVRLAVSNFLVHIVINHEISKFTTEEAAVYLNPVKDGNREKVVRDVLREWQNTAPGIMDHPTTGEDRRTYVINLEALKEQAEELGLTDMSEIPPKWVNKDLEWDLDDILIANGLKPPRTDEEVTDEVAKVIKEENGPANTASNVTTTSQTPDEAQQEQKRRRRGKGISIGNSPSGIFTIIMTASGIPPQPIGFHRDFKFFMGGYFEVNQGFEITQFSENTDLIMATKGEILYKFYPEPIKEGRL